MEHGAGAPGWVSALEASGLGEMMRSSMLLYPASNVLHLLAIVALVGPILALDLRLLGLGRNLDAAALNHYLTRFAVVALPVIVITGFAMFSADATALAGNVSFLAKLSLVAAALVNALVFRALWRRRLAGWNEWAPVAARFQAATSIVLWLGAVMAGRLIAYL